MQHIPGSIRWSHFWGSKKFIQVYTVTLACPTMERVSAEIMMCWCSNSNAFLECCNRLDDAPSPLGRVTGGWKQCLDLGVPMSHALVCKNKGSNCWVKFAVASSFLVPPNGGKVCAGAGAEIPGDPNHPCQRQASSASKMVSLCVRAQQCLPTQSWSANSVTWTSREGSLSFSPGSHCWTLMQSGWSFGCLPAALSARSGYSLWSASLGHGWGDCWCWFTSLWYYVLAWHLCLFFNARISSCTLHLVSEEKKYIISLKHYYDCPVQTKIYPRSMKVEQWY